MFKSVIKRIGWEHGLNPRTLGEDTETGRWWYISYHYNIYRCDKETSMKEYKSYKSYVQSLPKYEIVIEK